MSADPTQDREETIRLSWSVCRRARDASWNLSKPEHVRGGWRFTWHPPKGPDIPCKPGTTKAEALASACVQWLDWNATPATPAEERPDLEKWFGSRRPGARRR